MVILLYEYNNRRKNMIGKILLTIIMFATSTFSCLTTLDFNKEYKHNEKIVY